MPSQPPRDFKGYLNGMSPAAHDARLGQWLYEMSAQLTALQAQYNLLLAHLDTANVAGIGNANTASFQATLSNTLPEQR